MKTVYSPKHRLQHGQAELFGNKLVPCHERPARADAIYDRIKASGIGPVIEPQDFGDAPLKAVHAPDYVDFLKHAWADWLAAGGDGDALPCCTPMPDMGRRIPTSIYGKIAYYSFDTTAPLTAGTWEAAYASAQSAVTAADLLTKGEDSAFALCRPPGHHASRAYYAGYCFFNNAAIAAQSLIESGRKRVAILDVDYHHGNGTQSIFYDRDDVLFVSIHGDPNEDYPFFLGYAEEKGAGKGVGYNLNLPLRHGVTVPQWFEALNTSVQVIAGYKPEALVISLGVDTFEDDPISHFKLKSEDYLQLGAVLARLQVPTLFVMEGGYNVDAIGINVTNTLLGFEQAKKPVMA